MASLRRAATGGGAAIGFLVLVQVLWGPPAGIVVQGALLGGLSALLALGLALVYRANRILNFAQGDLGAAPASLAVLLVVSSGTSWLVAFVTGIAAAVVLGAAVELLVVRRFFRSPRLILTVATIGLAQVLAGLGLLLPRWFDVGLPPQSFPAPFDVSFTVDPLRFSGNDVVALLTIPLAFAGLAVFLRTRFGVAMRACADDADRAALVGIPVRRVHSVVWMIAAVLAFLAVFLRAGIVGLSIGTVLGPSLLLPALAAAVIGRMERLPTIALAAIALGVVEQSVVWGWNQPSDVQPVLFVVVLVAVWLTPAGSGLRGRIEPSTWRAIREPRPVPRELARLPEVRVAGAALLVLVALTLALVPFVFTESRTNLAAVALIYGVIALSLVVLTGWAGEISLGQMAFVAIGAAAGASMTSRLGWDLAFGLIGAGLVGAAVAALIGLPVLRRRGLTLAVITLAFSLAATAWLLNPRIFGDGTRFDWLPPPRVERPDLFGVVSVSSETGYYFLCLAALALVAFAVLGIRRSRTGRVLVAIRENELAASAYGVNPRRTTLGAFAISGFLAAFAGALFVHHQNGLQLGSYTAGESLVVFAMVVIGGLGSIPGALLGALFVRGVTWWLPVEWQILATGAGMLVVLLVFRGGFGAAFADLRDVGLRRIATRRGIVAPSLVAEPPARRPSAPRAADTRGGDAAGRAPALLQVRGLDVEYDGVQVLFDVDFDVSPGEIVALLGTNGSGKSTLLKAVSGLLDPEHGSVTFDGRTTTHARPEHIVALGVVQAPGGHGVFPSLTVAENLRLAAWSTYDRAATRRATADALALFPILADRSQQVAGNLSGGEQQMVTLAMALVARPRLLLIDELSLGLSPTVLARLREHLQRAPGRRHDDRARGAVGRSRAAARRPGLLPREGHRAVRGSRRRPARPSRPGAGRVPRSARGRDRSTPCRRRAARTTSRGRGRAPPLRRCDRARRRVVPDRRRRDRRRARTERCGQDHPLRRDLGLRRARRRVRRAPRRPPPRPHGARAARPSATRARPLVPGRAPVPGPHGARDGRGGTRTRGTRPRSDRGRAAPPDGDAFGSRGPRARRRAARPARVGRLRRQVRPRAVHRNAADRRPRVCTRPRADSAPPRRAFERHRATRSRGIGTDVARRA